MGIVYLFEKSDNKTTDFPETNEPDNDNATTCGIVNISSHPRYHGTENVTFRGVRMLLAARGVDFTCSTTREDFKIILFLVQGIIDRVEGSKNSDRCLMLNTLRLAFEYEERSDHGSEEYPGDL